MILEAPIDEVKVTAMTKGERARSAQVRVREERAQREEEELEEESESEAQDSGPVRVERGVAVDFHASVLEMLRDMRAEMLAEIRAVGARVTSVEKRVSWLVTAQEREARAAGQESWLPRRRFTLPGEQEEAEEETGQSSGEEATDGEEDSAEGAETEVSQFAEEEERVGEEVVEEAEGEVARTEGVETVGREEELGSGRDVAAGEAGLSGTADVSRLVKVMIEIAEAEREEEDEQLVIRRRGRHVTSPTEGSFREE